MSSSMGPVAAHCDDHGFPSTYADLALLDYLERQAFETPRVDDDSPEFQDAVEGAPMTTTNPVLRPDSTVVR